MLFLKPHQEWEQPRTTKLWWKRHRGSLLGFAAGITTMFTVSTVAAISLHKPPPPPTVAPPDFHPVTLKETVLYGNSWYNLVHTRVHNLQVTTNSPQNTPMTITSVYTGAGEGYGTIQAGSSKASTMLHQHKIYVTAGSDFWQAVGVKASGVASRWVLVATKYFNDSLYPKLLVWDKMSKATPDTVTFNGEYRTANITVCLDRASTQIVSVRNEKTSITVVNGNIKPIAPVVNRNVAHMRKIGVLHSGRNQQLIILSK